MLDFEVQRCTRHCAATDRELAPGETFYSVLVREGVEVIRRDYSVEAWPGPPTAALGWWKSQVPTPDSRRLHWAPNDVMLELFEELADDASRADLRYVLALLLIRRRVMRMEDDDLQQPRSGEQTLVVYCPRRDTQYRVAVVMPDGERTQQIQEELARLLFANAGP